jgi:hypothetical protein
MNYRFIDDELPASAFSSAVTSQTSEPLLLPATGKAILNASTGWILS